MKKISLFVFIIIALLCSCGEKHYNEWVEKNGNKYYYNEQGQKQTGWLKDGSSWYYLDSTSGKMLKNQWVDRYYLDEQGRMLTNISKEIDGKTYEFDINGEGKEVEPCQLIIDCQLPKTFKYTAVGYWYETIIENVSYEIEQSKYSSEYMVSIYLTGTAGNASSTGFQATRRVGFKLYDPNNIEIQSGEFFTYNSLKYGERFVNDYQSTSLFLKGKGVYRLKLLDCDHSYGFGVTW